MEDLKLAVLAYIAENPVVESSLDLAKKLNVTHNEIVGALKSLGPDTIQFLNLEQLETKRWELTADGEDYILNGTPEKRLFDTLPAEGVAMKELPKDTITQLGTNYGKVNGFFAIEAGKLKRVSETIVDKDAELLRDVQADKEITEDQSKLLLKRKTIKLAVTKYFKVSKGEKFALTLPKLATDLTHDMIMKGSWATTEFKKYNFNALGKEIELGNLHPLMKVRAQFKDVLLEMGFEEMPTNQYVESAFWNFDTLFQPQSHPARDSHDTFFVKDPASAEIPDKEYWEKVRNAHEKGGYGSIGWRYPWQDEEAKKNILRTHTTAVSAKMLYKLAKDTEKDGEFKPKKYFSIDRVFRNETLDATHLAEFHQVEGLIADRGLGFAHLKTVISVFFKKIGLEKIKFKPAYNPYTEPSAEIFAFHPILNRWVEIGNSGVFRPEMLGPMGLPSDVSVIAWGLSLERPTMINYNIGNIRDLFGHSVSVKEIRSNAICCFQK